MSALCVQQPGLHGCPTSLEWPGASKQVTESEKFPSQSVFQQHQKMGLFEIKLQGKPNWVKLKRHLKKET